MKTNKLEKWILLEQSGELSPRRRKMLDACPDAAAKRAELNALCSAVQPADAEPSPWCVTRINARLKTERRSLLLPARVWQPILALAACLTLIVTTFDFMPETSTTPPTVLTAAETYAWSVQFDEDLAELESLILAISGTPLDITEM